MRNFRPLAVLAARAADDKKAEDITLLQIKAAGLADFLLLVTVDSPAHLEAVEQGVGKAFKAKGMSLLRRERSDRWRVLDYGGLLVHLMHRETRELYALEKMYVDAKRVAWQEKAGGKKRG